MVVRVAAAVAALMAFAIGSSAAQARKPHGLTFAGLESATTCLPGPGVLPGEASSYHLAWEAAKDRPRLAPGIVYEVYQATTRGGEDFAAPTYTTARAMTSFDTPKLFAQDTYFFVVRARDGAGREDRNTVELEGQNLCE
jgi:hypothetical protein